MNSAAIAMRRELETRLSSYALNVPQWVVLATLLDGALSIDEVCARLEWDRPSVLTAIQNLEGRDLVTRRPSDSGSRELVMELTASGTALMRRLPMFADEVNARALAGFTPQEREVFVALLARVCKNLSR